VAHLVHCVSFDFAQIEERHGRGTRRGGPIAGDETARPNLKFNSMQICRQGSTLTANRRTRSRIRLVAQDAVNTRHFYSRLMKYWWTHVGAPDANDVVVIKWEALTRWIAADRFCGGHFITASGGKKTVSLYYRDFYYI
jgi:hypothetical protein